jgi:hypothetical protein
MEEVQMAMKQMQIKTTLSFHVTSLKMDIFKVNNNNKCWRGYGKTGIPTHCWWEGKLVQPTRKAIWRFLRKLKIELPYDPVILLLGIYPKKC